MYAPSMDVSAATKTPSRSILWFVSVWRFLSLFLFGGRTGGGGFGVAGKWEGKAGKKSGVWARRLVGLIGGRIR